MAGSNRGVLAAEQSLGWLFKKGMSRGGLAEYDHDRLIAVIIQGVDLIKQKALAIGQQATRSSQDIQADSDALFEEFGSRIWLGRGHKSKPAWVADAGPAVCGGRYLRDLCFTNPQDHRRLKSLFHQMVLAKCRAFRQNRKQKDKPRPSSASYADSTGVASKDEEGPDVGDDGEDLDDQFDDTSDVMSWSGAQNSVQGRELQSTRWNPEERYSVRYATADRAQFAQEVHEPDGHSDFRERLTDGPLRRAQSGMHSPALSTSNAHSQRGSLPSSGSRELHYLVPGSPSSMRQAQAPIHDTDVRRSRFGPASWNALLSPLDEDKLLQLTSRSSDPHAPKSSRDAMLDLLQRIDLELNLPVGVCKVNLARCVSREALFERIDQTNQAAVQSRGAGSTVLVHDQVYEISFAADLDNDFPEELRRMQFRRGGFRDQYPGFLQYMRQIDNGWDTYSLSANAQIRSQVR